MNRVAATSTLGADWSVTTLTQRVRRVADSPRNGSILYKLSFVWPRKASQDGPPASGSGR